MYFKILSFKFFFAIGVFSLLSVVHDHISNTTVFKYNIIKYIFFKKVNLCFLKIISYLIYVLTEFVLHLFVSLYSVRIIFHLNVIQYFWLETK